MPVISKAVPSLFILASSVCKSLQSLISILTQGGKDGHSFRLTCSVVLWGGRKLRTDITGVCGECAQCLGHTGFAPAHGVCAFLVYTVQGTGCSAGELSTAGPGLRALPRAKSLRFRSSGTPQRRRVSWACVLCLPHVRAAQASRCLASALSRWAVRLITTLVPAAQFPGCAMRAPSRVCLCLLWGADL